MQQKAGWRRGLENARSPARCQPGPRAKPHGAAAHLEPHETERHKNIFELAGADYTLRASFWPQFLH
jgi:hypothetical protein